MQEGTLVLFLFHLEKNDMIKIKEQRLYINTKKTVLFVVSIEFIIKLCGDNCIEQMRILILMMNV